MIYNENCLEGIKRLENNSVDKNSFQAVLWAQLLSGHFRKLLKLNIT